MTIDALIQRLIDIRQDYRDKEVVAHVLADEALLAYINDQRVTDAFESIDKWYE